VCPVGGRRRLNRLNERFGDNVTVNKGGTDRGYGRIAGELCVQRGLADRETTESWT